LERERSIRINDVPAPEPAAEEILIHVSLAGICGSDYSLYNGKFGVPLPVIPGHEAVGTITAKGDRVTHLELGQRVTIQPNFSCGRCPLCTSGSGNLCQSKVRLGVDTNGVFAEYVRVPARYAWPIPDGMDDATAVFAEPLAVGVHAMKTLAPVEGAHVLIFGAGVMGLLIQQLTVLHGAQASAADLSAPRLSLARALGAVRTIGTDVPLEDGFNAFDYVYETSGAPAALDLAIRLAAPKGKIVVLGLPGREHAVSTDMIVRKELQIFGSIVYTDEFPESLRILKRGVIQTEALTTARIGLSELDGALKDFQSPGRVKTLVNIDERTTSA
jgi:2-desacetyl-2-hydroxyethyl bacteriochlorophyllide A dehydrogenase